MCKSWGHPFNSQSYHLLTTNFSKTKGFGCHNYLAALGKIPKVLKLGFETWTADHLTTT
jgi:hypothetical protein